MAYSLEDYARFFGDMDLAKQSLSNDETFSWSLLEDLHDANIAYRSLCRIRNRNSAIVGLTPEQFGQRQALLDIARELLFAERRKLLDQFVRLAPRGL